MNDMTNAIRIILVALVAALTGCAVDYDAGRGSAVSGSAVVVEETAPTACRPDADGNLVGGIVSGMTLVVSPELAEKSALVTKSVEAWETAMAGGLELNVRVGDDVQPGEIAVRAADLPGKRGGEWGCEALTLWIDLERVSGKGDSVFVLVVEHELGHGLGLEHQEAGLMAASASGAPCIDELSVAIACDSFACGETAAATCR